MSKTMKNVLIVITILMVLLGISVVGAVLMLSGDTPSFVDSPRIFLGSFLFFFSLWRSSSDFLHHAREECTPSLLLLSKNHRHTEKAFFLWRESFLFCCLSLFSNRRRASVFLNRRPKEEREREAFDLF